MSDTDDNDPFDDVDFGELLARSELRSERKKEIKNRKGLDESAQDLSGVQSKGGELTIPTSKAVIQPKSPRMSDAPSPPRARTKISQQRVIINQTQKNNTTPPVAKPERVIPTEYILSPEITRMAQLPRYTYGAISAQALPENEHADYDITSSGVDTGDDALQAFYHRTKRTVRSYRQLLLVVDSMLHLIRSARAEYRPVFSQIELSDLSSEIRSMYEEISSFSHDARRVLRHRRQSIRYLRLGHEFSYSKEASSHYIKQCQALEPIEQLRQSSLATSRAMNGLREFYSCRQIRGLTKWIRGLPKPIRRSFFKSLQSFKPIDDYRDVIFRRFRPGPGPQLAYKVGQSLSQLGIRARSLREVQFAQTITGNATRPPVQLPDTTIRNLEQALYEYYEFETYKTARRNAMKAKARRLHQDNQTSEAKDPICELTNLSMHEKGPSKGMVHFRAAKPSTIPASGAPEVDTPLQNLDAPSSTSDSKLFIWQQQFRRDLKARSLIRDTAIIGTYSAASTRESDSHNDQNESTNATITRSCLQKQEPTSIGDSHQVLGSATHPINSETSNSPGVENSPAAVAATTYSSHSPIGYSMNRGAQQPVDNSSQKPAYWSYALYTGPENEKVKVHYCKNISDTERVAQLFLGQEVIGFDIEWKPNAQAKDGVKKNVSLIQIASEERVALFHIARYPGTSADDLVAPTLKAIMESQDIIKVGVAIKGDCTRLRRFMGIEPRGLLELSHLYKLVKFSENNAHKVNKTLVRLATQVEEHLGLPLSKGGARMSDWSLDLNIEQVQYAASDSYAGFQLFHTLEHKRKLLNPTPPRPHHAELDLPIRLATGKSIETDDEPTSVEEEDSETSEPGTTPTIEELARDFMKLAMACPVLPTAKTTTRTPKPDAAQCKAEVVAANEWVAQWRTTLAKDYKPSAAPACLRAYALWHGQGFSVPEAAALLREPPLLESTVASYVLDALRAEKLPFKQERLAALHSYVPQAAKDRYRRFLEKAGVVVG